MGGGYYDRTVYTSKKSTPSYSSPKSSGYSNQSDKVFKVQSRSSKLHKSCDPKRFKSPGSYLHCKRQNPIVFAVDVTGSMGNWTKIIYDKLPMFYGQIKQHAYLEDPSLCFTAVGDAYTDMAPAQICDFGEGKQIDQLITKLWLESGGGGQIHESYELTAFFLQQKLDMKNAKKKFCFFTGDENFYKSVKKNQIKKVLGMDVQSDYDSFEVFKNLKKKFDGNVYLLHIPYGNNNKTENRILNDWKKALGPENVINMKNGKAVIDMALGVIAIATGERSLSEYVQDLRNRNQDEQRIKEIQHALKLLSSKFRAKPLCEKLVKKLNAKAYGIIPIKIVNNKAKVFIAQHAKFKHYDFIKGMPKSNSEDGKSVAERRLKEECGLNIIEYITPKKFKTKYEITNWTGYKVEKKVYWYLAQVNENVNINQNEISDFKWLDINKVENLLTFHSSKILFKEVIPYIEKRLKIQ